jgi:hypothetical protein
VAKQSTSCETLVRYFQRAVQKRGYAVARRGTRETPLHYLATLCHQSNYSPHVNQELILAKQLIEHGANVNAVPSPKGATTLCYSDVIVNEIIDAPD